MPTYRYTGDVPTVFIGLQKDGTTWTPSRGDEITVDVTVGHPWLKRIEDTGELKVPDRAPRVAVASVPDPAPDPKTS